MLLEFDYVRFWHYAQRVDVVLSGEGLHVLVQLALHSDLVDAVDMVVNLVGEEVLDDADPPDLSHQKVREADGERHCLPRHWHWLCRFWLRPAVLFFKILGLTSLVWLLGLFVLRLGLWF